jgi:hypothetical protein
MEVHHRIDPDTGKGSLYLNCVRGLEFIPKQGCAYICFSLYVLLVTRLHMGLSPTSKTF